MSDKLSRELKSFDNLWKGGTTLSKQRWDDVAKTRDINSIYHICIQPYVNKNTNVLEIGCNGGGWTQKMLHAKTITGFDALSAEHTGFWDNIEKTPKIKYFQVKDFNCNELENNFIDYVFSYDVFCHISYSGAKAYLKNLYPKLKYGANLFIMIADAEKYKNKNGLAKLLKRSGFDNMQDFLDDYDGEAKNGRWFFYGTKRFLNIAKGYGYKVMDKDVVNNSDLRSPIIWIKK